MMSPVGTMLLILPDNFYIAEHSEVHLGASVMRIVTHILPHTSKVKLEFTLAEVLPEGGKCCEGVFVMRSFDLPSSFGLVA